MPWKASSVMEEKVRFVVEYEREEQTMTELSESFGISRETGYVWLRRYRALGLEGLLELNRAAKRHPNQTVAAIEQAVLELRGAHMNWGPRKLQRVLERDQPGSTVAGGEHHWGAAEARGAGGRAQEATAHGAVHATAGPCRWLQSGVVRRFQGMVSQRQRRAHRSIDHLGCLQPLSAALPGGGEDQHGAGASDL